MSVTRGQCDARPTVTFPAAKHHRPLAGTKLYLVSYCTPVTSQTGRSKLRSATTGQLMVPRTRTAYGSRSFAVHGPVVWNSLPAELRSPDISMDVFRKQLKTLLFNC